MVGIAPGFAPGYDQIMQPSHNEISMRDFTPSKAAIAAALGNVEQADHRDNTRHMQPAAQQHPGNRGVVPGRQSPGNANLSNQQPLQSRRNSLHNDRIS